MGMRKWEGHLGTERLHPGTEKMRKWLFFSNNVIPESDLLFLQLKSRGAGVSTIAA